MCTTYIHVAKGALSLNELVTGSLTSKCMFVRMRVVSTCACMHIYIHVKQKIMPEALRGEWTNVD